MKHLDISEIAKADLRSIRRSSLGTWGPERTSEYMSALRDTMKGLARQTIVSRERDDLRPGLRMALTGRHCLFFEESETRIQIVVCSTTGWNINATCRRSEMQLARL